MWAICFNFIISIRLVEETSIQNITYILIQEGMTLFGSCIFFNLEPI